MKLKKKVRADAPATKPAPKRLEEQVKQAWTGCIEIEDGTPSLEQTRAWREFWDEQYARAHD